MSSNICLLASIAINAHFIVYVSAENKFESTNFVNGNTDISNHHPNVDRQIRSVLSIGKATMEALLKGTKEVPTKSIKYKKYLKQGNLPEAISDFKSVNPNLIDIDRKQFKLEGVLEDRTFLRLRMYDRSNHRRPTIFVEDSEGKNAVKIIYCPKIFTWCWVNSISI